MLLYSGRARKETAINWSHVKSIKQINLVLNPAETAEEF
jgi:sporulation protein YlmC with PRC-barrel domain